MNPNLADSYRRAWRHEYARNEALVAACRQAQAWARAEAANCQHYGVDAPDELIDMLQVLDAILAEEAQEQTT